MRKYTVVCKEKKVIEWCCKSGKNLEEEHAEGFKNKSHYRLHQEIDEQRKEALAENVGGRTPF